MSNLSQLWTKLSHLCHITIIQTCSISCNPQQFYYDVYHQALNGTITLALLDNIVASDSNTPLPSVSMTQLSGNEGTRVHLLDESHQEAADEISPTLRISTCRWANMANTLEKGHWNHYTRNMDREVIGRSKNKMTSLEYLNIKSCEVRKLHSVLLEVSNALDIWQATVKAQVLVK